MTTLKNSLLKVIILGDGGVGKTCLMNRYVSNTFEVPFHTIGVEFMDKEISVNGENFTLQIWDTAGQERFKSLRTPFYRGSDICLLVFAVNDKRSFSNLNVWKKEFLHYADIKDASTFPFIVIANKIDLETREVSEEEAKEWCELNGKLHYTEASAKCAINVDAAFNLAIQVWLSREESMPYDSVMGKTISLGNNDSSSSTCCSK